MNNNKVFVRKVTSREGGIIASERLDLTIDQNMKRCGFGFTSRIQGVADIRGSVAFPGDHNDNELTHSSGSITSETITNMVALTALLDQLDLCLASGKTDEEIFNDKKIKLILKNNRFEEITSF